MGALAAGSMPMIPSECGTQSVVLYMIPADTFFSNKKELLFKKRKSKSNDHCSHNMKMG